MSSSTETLLFLPNTHTRKHADTQRLTFSRVRECSIAITREHRGEGEEKKKEGGGRDGIISIRFDGMVM